jgi:adenylate cyclase
VNVDSTDNEHDDNEHDDNDDGTNDGTNEDDFEAAGLYDPGAPNARARLELLEYLLGRGVSIPEMMNAEHGLLSLAALRTLRPETDRCTLAEAAGKAGVEHEFALRVWRASGFPDPRPHERSFSDRDVAMLALARSLRELVGTELVVQLMRTMGESTARIAEAEIALLRANIEAPLLAEDKLIAIAQSYVTVAETVLPRVVDAIDTLHRHHLETIGRRYSDAGTVPSAANLAFLTVGFADLAGYTGLSQELDPAELGGLLSTFETITGDVIAAAGAHVVKRIGDAVMFVTSAPGIACRVALDLVDACAAGRLPRLRTGLAFGEVMVRQGDFHGPTVNLAARLVTAAEPGVVLTDAQLAGRLARLDDRYSFAPAGRYTLAGFADPVEAYQLLRARPW